MMSEDIEIETEIQAEKQNTLQLHRTSSFFNSLFQFHTMDMYRVFYS